MKLRVLTPARCWPLAAAVVLAWASSATADAVRDLQLFDLSGRKVQPLARGGAKATVFVFVRTDCPISNAYAPEIQRLHAKFSRAGVALWLVYLDRDQSSAAIREHLAAFSLPWPALRDSKHELARLCRTRVTPEAAVFSRTGQRVYHGRIDDRWAALGKRKPKATSHELEEAITATLDNRPAPRASAPAVGCAIADLQ